LNGRTGGMTERMARPHPFNAGRVDHREAAPRIITWRSALSRSPSAHKQIPCRPAHAA
jgi:hypothetical protein